jgi:hypothetical protein
VNHPKTKLKTALPPSRSVVLAGVTTHAQHQAQGVHEQMPLVALDAFASIIAHFAAMAGRFAALTVQYRGRGLAAFALGLPDAPSRHAGCA